MDLGAPPPEQHEGPSGWRQWLQNLYGNERLYRWSLTNPLTRHITRRRTRQLFDLMAGFVHSQVLLGCVRLNLFAMLRDRPDTPKGIAQRTGVPEERLQRLLLSAVSIGLLEPRGEGRLGIGPLGVPLTTHPGIADMVEHNHLLYEDLRDPVAFLSQDRQGDMAGYWPYAQGGLAAVQAPEAAGQVQRYSDLMARSQGFLVHEILRSYGFDRHRCVLDVGAGQGRFISALAQQAPHLQLKMFDLPPVLKMAGERLAREGVSDRVALHPGSFLDDPLPTGADLITLVRVLHDHPDAVVRQVIAKAFAALPEGGELLVAEPMALATEGPTPNQADAYYHFYLMAMGGGRLRTPEEIGVLMREAGFIATIQVPNAMPIHGQLVLGRKPRCLPSLDA